ncbi:amidohydrolase [Pseudarthrobacter sp. AG30]|uniref:amidohydrolase family protein n=1 Tax=Pseudarthrobacter sp. AG30 TaxID=2249742 RepID=UPI000D6E4D96|nr:amidohydrolase family protein [Pseudarthrobacter sp. AG30]RAX14752.1 amidohydrolase [Pseudarthrobacter sp. AG30]
MTVTDVHAHLLMPGLHREVEQRAPGLVQEAATLERLRNGADSLKISGEMIGSRIAKLTDPLVRLESMDAQGVDKQWVSASPNHFYPWAQEDLAVWASKETNRLIAEHVANAPDRLIGLGVVPLQHPHRVVECIDNAVDHKLVGVEISSFAGDVELSDPRLEPAWARLEEQGLVVFLHPFGCSLDERLDRYYLSNTVGQPTENAVALSHLIFSGVLDRYPNLKVLAAHGGGYLPTAVGRSDRAWKVRPEARGCEHPPSEYLKKLWFDTVVHDEAALRQLVNVAGSDRVMLGSDYPFDMGLDDPVNFILGTKLPEVATVDILGRNAEKLVDGASQGVRG